MEKSTHYDADHPEYHRCPLPENPHFRQETHKRLDLIQEEFQAGFNFLYPLKKEVTFFGSARFNEDDKYYKMAHELAKRLGEEGYTIVTGGGPGVMEAANRGASEINAPSIGLNIELPKGQRSNSYVSESIGFHYFFSRKVMLSASAQAYVFFPGGFGTLDEFFEMVTLVQTEKMERVPIVLVGKEYWEPLLSFIKERLVKEFKTVSPHETGIFVLAESVEDALALVNASKERTYF